MASRETSESVPFKTQNDTLRESIAKLFNTSAYSDLIITCGNDRYNVHKAIVCPRSSFFEAACDGNFKEALNGIIDLPDDDPETVQLMVHYLYHLDYTPIVNKEPADNAGSFDHLPSAMRNRRRREQRIKMEQKTSARALYVHAKAYALGEKYGIQCLKALAAEKFEDDVRMSLGNEDSLLAVQEVYTSTIDQDRQLRDVVVKAFSEKISLLNKESVQKVVKSTELCFDLLMHVTSENR